MSKNDNKSKFNAAEEKEINRRVEEYKKKVRKMEIDREVERRISDLGLPAI